MKLVETGSNILNTVYSLQADLLSKYMYVINKQYLMRCYMIHLKNSLVCVVHAFSDDTVYDLQNQIRYVHHVDDLRNMNLK